MSDDLVKRLRDRANKQLAATPVSLLRQSADRIENLEMKLATALALIETLEGEQARADALEAQLSQANAALEAADNLWEYTNELLHELEYLGVSDGGISMLEVACGAYKKARRLDED